MSIPKGLKKKIENAIKAYERKKLKNNYFITKEPDTLKDIPERSLVVVLTPYHEKVPETSLQ